MSNANKNDQDISQMHIQFKPILTDHKIIKNLSPSIQQETINPEFSIIALRLIKNLQSFISNLSDTNINEFENRDFFSNYNDVINQKKKTKNKLIF